MTPPISNTHNDHPIVIVGAGWAGLAAAVSLIEAGKKVFLLEAAPQAGGRARSIQFGEHLVDNGQHLLVGAYQQTLALLKTLNIPENTVLERCSFNYHVMDLTHPRTPIQIQLSHYPKPWNLLNGIFHAKGLSLTEKLSALKLGKLLFKKKYLPLERDISVYDFLIKHQQPESLITKLWNPLALAALTTPIKKASAEVFLKVLIDTLTQDPTHSDWLIPKRDLNQVFPNPVIQYLAQHHSTIQYHQRVQKLIIENGYCEGVQTENKFFPAQSVILALPPQTTANLLQTISLPNDLPEHRLLVNQLEAFRYQPITTVYLETKEPVNLPSPMMGLIHATGHWLFDRRLNNQANILSIVLSGEGAYRNLDPAELIQSLLAELIPFSPALQHIVQHRVITEKRAAFSCEVGSNYHRPTAKTPYPKLWLAGDYTQTGYPATLEGAVRSGIKAAEQVLLASV